MDSAWKVARRERTSVQDVAHSLGMALLGSKVERIHVVCCGAGHRASQREQLLYEVLHI